jgi:hypothetical protein
MAEHGEIGDWLQETHLTVYRNTFLGQYLARTGVQWEEDGQWCTLQHCQDLP